MLRQYIISRPWQHGAEGAPCSAQLARMQTALATVCMVCSKSSQAQQMRGSPAAAFLASLSAAVIFRAASASAARLASRSAVFLRSCSFSCHAFSASCERPRACKLEAGYGPRALRSRNGRHILCTGVTCL